MAAESLHSDPSIESLAQRLEDPNLPLVDRIKTLFERASIYRSLSRKEWRNHNLSTNYSKLARQDYTAILSFSDLPDLSRQDKAMCLFYRGRVHRKIWEPCLSDFEAALAMEELPRTERARILLEQGRVYHPKTPGFREVEADMDISYEKLKAAIKYEELSDPNRSVAHKLMADFWCQDRSMALENYIIAVEFADDGLRKAKLLVKCGDFFRHYTYDDFDSIDVNYDKAFDYYNQAISLLTEENMAHLAKAYFRRGYLHYKGTESMAPNLQLALNDFELYLEHSAAFEKKRLKAYRYVIKIRRQLFGIATESSCRCKRHSQERDAETKRQRT